MMVKINKVQAVTATIIIVLLASFFTVLVLATTDTIGTTANNDAAYGYIEVDAITASASGTLSSIGVDVQTSAGNIRASIYSTYSSSKCSGLLNQSASVATASGWVDLSVKGVTITQGTTYYIAFQTSSSSCKTYYATSGGASYYATMTYGSFVDPSATLTSNGAVADNMRINYNSSSTNYVVTDTFSSSSSWNLKDKWASNAGLIFSSTTSWNNKDHWSALVKDTYSTSTSWSRSLGIWTSHISSSFSSATSWLIGAKWSATVKPSMTTTTSWSDSEHWVGKIAVAYSSSTSWSDLTHLVITVKPSMSTTTSWSDSTHWVSKVGVTFATVTVWSSLPKWISHIGVSFASTFSNGINIVVVSMHNYIIGLSASLNVSWNVISVQIGIITGNSTDTIVVGVIASVTTACVMFALFYTKKRRNEEA